MRQTPIDVLTSIVKAFRTRPGQGHTKAMIEGVENSETVKIIVANEKSKKESIDFIYQGVCVSMMDVDQKLQGYQGPIVIDNHAFTLLGEEVLAQYMGLTESTRKTEQRLRTTISDKNYLTEELASLKNQELEALQYFDKMVDVWEGKEEDDAEGFEINDLLPIVFYMLSALGLVTSIIPMAIEYLNSSSGGFFSVGTALLCGLAVVVWGVEGVQSRAKKSKINDQIDIFKDQIERKYGPLRTTGEN